MKKSRTSTRGIKNNSAPAGFRLDRDDLRLIGMMIAIKALLFLYAGQAYQALSNQRITSVRGWFEIWDRWDAINYQRLAQFGYLSTDEMRPRLVFYPLYPWFVR